VIIIETFFTLKGMNEDSASNGRIFRWRGQALPLLNCSNLICSIMPSVLRKNFILHFGRWA